MKPLLHHWILPSQTGFVPNRCILDNIFLAFEAIEWTKENNQDLCMLLLDFEKAYDRVNWTFLKQTMEQMGFHEQWITQVMSLNLNASASILVNGQSSKPFKLQRSMRQGCPLAPYLFLLTVDVLGQMLQHPQSGVQGLRLPDNTTITNQMFADDTLLLLDGMAENMDRALNVITRFGAASGAKLNLHKSIGVWVAHTERTWQWGEDAGLKWLPPGEVTRYLRYPFGLNIPQREKDNRMLTQIRKHLARWADKKLSLAGRIMVSNQVILSSIWYLASCSDISGHALKIARATVRNFMWSGQKVSKARARVKWATAVLPIVRGGIKILDPQWQASALLVKLLVRGLSVGYEPWKALVRHRVAQTRQSRRGRWPAHANWIMNAPHLAKQGSTLWQGVMKAWSSIQSGLEQQDPTSWSEISRQPLFGNRLLTNDNGVPWGMDPRSNMLWWAEKEIRSLKDIAHPEGYGWQTLTELKIRRTRIAIPLYAKVIRNIPWEARPMPPPSIGQWMATPTEDGSIQTVYQIQQTEPLTAAVYTKGTSEEIKHTGETQPLPEGAKEVRIIRSAGPKHTVLDFNPQDDTEEDQTLWLWGNTAVINLEWDPKEWNWRRLGILPDTNILNYATKRGYRVALKQDNNRMEVDVELEAAGYNSKSRAKFFNRIWHPYLPRKVSALQWLILTGGLPVGAWREKVGLPSACQLCPGGERETLQHSFQNCIEVRQAWELFRTTRALTDNTPAYHSWKDISRGLLTEPDGPSVEEDLRWDTASSFSINTETPWDILRAQLLWAIWCQRVAHSFSDEQFHLGVVLWHAWRNTIYCAMEAYKELHRHKRNEEKRQELISCFQKIWTTGNIFGRRNGSAISWHLTPHQEFLPQELGAWTIPPLGISRPSQSPDAEAEFAARPDFEQLVQDLIQDAGRNWRPAPQEAEPEPQHPPGDGQEAEDNPTNDLNGTNPQEPRSNPQTTTTIQPRLQPKSRPKRKCARHKGKPIDKRADATLTNALHPVNILGERNLNLPTTSTRPRPLPPRSRPKARCHFGPGSKRTILNDTHQPPLDTPAPAQNGTDGDTLRPRGNSPPASSPHRMSDGQRDATDLEALLQEIDNIRRIPEEIDEPQVPESAHPVEPHPPLRQAPSPKSRPKTKCKFGPKKGRTIVFTSSSLATETPALSPPELEVTSHDPPPTHPPEGASTSTAGADQTSPPRLYVPPDRVTLQPPAFHKSSPFERYEATAAPAPTEDPYRFVLARLGIDKAEFDARIATEVDELLGDLRDQRRRDIPLTKDDCLQYFQQQDEYPTGALLGVYRWAADLGIPRFNFECGDTAEDYNLLNAYD